MLHHTKNPSQQAQDITDRLQQEHECELANKGQDIYGDWPRYWLTTYDRVHAELIQTLTE
jgi:hypothetical protein